MDNGVLVRLAAISKSYGGVKACRDVDLTVRAGEVHALLGENGAGKSTLMRVLSGDVTDYQGSITVDGQDVRFHGPADAQRVGIAMIHQELDLVPGLSVAENIFLGREPRTRLRTLDRREMLRATKILLRRTGIDLDPRRPVGELRTGEQQLVTIAKALSLDAKVLIMDEPTSALSAAEVERMFTAIAELRRAGAGIVYISHRMDEIGRIADRATVLRNGSVVAEFDAKDMTAEQAAEAMIGRPVQAMFTAHEAGPAAGNRMASASPCDAARSSGSRACSGPGARNCWKPYSVLEVRGRARSGSKAVKYVRAVRAGRCGWVSRTSQRIAGSRDWRSTTPYSPTPFCPLWPNWRGSVWCPGGRRAPRRRRSFAS
jgi:ribose transport system ATP-binding protein